MAEEEPDAKKFKKEESEIDPIFYKFLKEKEKKDYLYSALQALKLGLSKMNLGIVQIVEANARSGVRFARSTCYGKMYKDPDNEFSKDATFITGNIFIDGIDVVEKYLDESNPAVLKIPRDVYCRTALSKLLMFILKENHGALFGGNVCEKDLALIVAQHLLSELSVYSTYMVEEYPGLSEDVCPCEEHDELVGKIGDTSFGETKLQIVSERQEFVRTIPDTRVHILIYKGINNLELHPENCLSMKDAVTLTGQILDIFITEHQLNGVYGYTAFEEGFVHSIHISCHNVNAMQIVSTILHENSHSLLPESNKHYIIWLQTNAFLMALIAS